jgi:hypothetical protein
MAATLKTSPQGSEDYLGPKVLIFSFLQSVISGSIYVYYAGRHPCQLQGQVMVCLEMEIPLLIQQPPAQASLRGCIMQP